MRKEILRALPLKGYLRQAMFPLVLKLLMEHFSFIIIKGEWENLHSAWFLINEENVIWESFLPSATAFIFRVPYEN